MNPKINFITLAVADLQKSFDFYKEGLGFPVSGYKEGDDHVVFEMEDSIGLVLYRREKFLLLTNNPNEQVRSAGFILSHFTGNQEDVNTLLASALKAGAILVKEAREESWGYTASFSDPDGHLWEICFNPNILPDGDTFF